MIFRSVLFFLVFLESSHAETINAFVDDDSMRGLETLGIHSIDSQVVHILLEGPTEPLNQEQIQAVQSAFTETYNEVYGSEGFQMDSISIMEQQVHGPERKYVLNTSNEFEIQFEIESYVTLVANLEGTAPPGLRAFGDADYIALQKRFWERKACQVILTGHYTPAQLRLCYMTNPRRRLREVKKGDNPRVDAVVE